MPKIDQLEIIAPDGRIFFHDLDPAKGITNIGSHPDNEIVINSPQISPFQAVLDHQQKPFRLMVLSSAGNPRLGGQSLQPNLFQEVRDWQTIDLDGFSLTVLENMDVPERLRAPSAPTRISGDEVLPAKRPGLFAGKKIVATPPPQTVPAVEAGSPPVSASQPPQGTATEAPESAPVLPVQAGIFPTRPVDQLDEIIITELAPREWTVEVEQPVSAELMIVNGGPIVATFDVLVDGIDPSWVTVFPTQVNLNEGGRARVNISITPPRHSSTLAGLQHFAVTVTSPNHPGRVGRLGATLVINPYYEFSVGNLFPAQQSASWRARSASASFPITNFGNSPAGFQIIAQDNENACRFEFPLPDQASLVKQVEVHVKPGETLSVPVVIFPLKRSLVRLRPRSYHYTVTTQSINDATAQRMIAAMFSSRPLFGIFPILLVILLLALTIFLIFQPHLDEFSVTPEVVALGQPVTLTWKAPLFTNELQMKDVAVEIKANQNQLSVTPVETLTSYTLLGRNWLSKLLSLKDFTLTTRPVLAIPPYPEISTLTVDKPDVILGQETMVKWAIKNASEAVLTVENVPISLTKEEMSGQRPVVLKNNSLVKLEAKNASGSAVRSEYVRVWGPNDLKVDFKVDPPEVTSGNPVTVTWEVAGSGFTVDTVTVAPFNEPLPAKFSLKYYPVESMYFVLKVKVRDYELSLPKYVTVLPADAKPVIDYFKINPPVLAGAGPLEFSWSVSGPVDAISISNKSGVVQGKLKALGFQNIQVSESGTYVLTATKGSQSASAVVQVQVIILRDVNVAITSMVPPTGILRDKSAFVYFSVTPVNPTDAPEVSGEVVVTDGFDSCKVALPIKSCELFFRRSDNDKKITATYSGDANYRQKTSALYPETGTIQVIGSTVALKNVVISFKNPAAAAAGAARPNGTLAPKATTVMVGQTGYVQFDLEGTGGSTTPVQGVYSILASDLTTNLSSSVCVNQQLALGKLETGESIGRGMCSFVFDGMGNKALIVRYVGNDIYDSYDSSPNNTDMNLVVQQAKVKVSIVSATPPATVQVRQSASLVLKAEVDPTQGVGWAVPGLGTITVKQNGTAIPSCTNLPVDANGGVTCAFTPDVVAPNLTVSYTKDAKNDNYASLENAPLAYQVVPAEVHVGITGVQFQPQGVHINPVVGQKVIAQLQVKSGLGADITTGTLLVYLQDRVNSDPAKLTPVCSIPLPATPLQCEVMMAHGGSNTIRTGYADSSNNYQGKTLQSRDLIADAAAVTLKSLLAAKSPALEDDVVTFTIEIAPTVPTVLPLAGNFTITSNGQETPCSAPLPDQKSCDIRFIGNAVASRTMTASFGDGIDYLPATMSLPNYPVYHITTTRILSNSANPKTFGSTTINFNVSAVYGAVVGMPVPTGRVTINGVDSGMPSCVGSLDATGAGLCALNNLPAGSHNFTATYDPQGSTFVASSSTTYLINVAKEVTTLSLKTQNPDPSYVRDAVLVTISSQNKGVAPTGTAVITARKADGTQAVCQSVIQLVNGEGSCSLRMNVAGDYLLYYTYSGDGSYDAVTLLSPLLSSGVQAAHTVKKYPSKVEILDILQNGSARPVTINYAVSKLLVNGSTLADALTGTVEVTVTGQPTLKCTGTLSYNSATGIASGNCPLLFPGPGDYLLNAAYSGDTLFDLSASAVFPMRLP